MLQALNILENFDLKSMGFNSARYIHTVYQAMNLSFADRDFYYGDPAFPPQEPMQGLLSKEYAKQRAKQINPDKNDAKAGPGDPYPFQGQTNPYKAFLEKWGTASAMPPSEEWLSQLRLGTTSVEAADKEGWVVSITPSGGWIPACIAGKTGVGMSQRMQSFVVDETENPFNVVAPGKQPRVTLTPTLALKDGKPFLSFAVQGGDTQDQNLLQFFLNVVEFDMNVQEATEAPNINTNQLRLSLGGDDRKAKPGSIILQSETPDWIRKELRKMGYTLSFEERTSGPINAIYFDWKHGGFWGGSSNHGEDYGIAW
jgi:gamma-glutamyltranspeptidase/glutathione hydrolase